MRTRAPVIAAALGAFLLASLGDAQTMPSTAVATSDQSDNKSIDAKSTEVPVDIRPFQLILPKDHLFGDWLGMRTELEKIGIAPTLSIETDIAGNPAGGKAHSTVAASNVGLDLLFDLDRIGGLKGGSFLLQTSQRFGASLSKDYIGNVFDTQQVFGGETFHIVDAAYQQNLFGDRLEFRIGRLAAGDDFLVSPYNYLFMQNGFDGNPVGIFFNAPGMTAYPNATWGALAKLRPTERTYVMVGVYNGDLTIRKNSRDGVDGTLNGPIYVMGEGGIQVNGLPGDNGPLGDYKVGFWFDNTNAREFGSTETKRGSWGVYGLFDQVLIPFAQRQSNRGLGVFGSVILSTDPSVAQLPYFFTAGVAARGVFASRPTDSCGLGVVYGHFSNELQSFQEQEHQVNSAIGVQDYELAAELTYRFYFRSDALFVQPDLQYIAHPGGTGRIKDAVVLGCQMGINF